MNNGLAELAVVANIIIALAVLGLAGIAAAVAIKLRSVDRKANELLARMKGDLGPIVRNVHEVSEHLAAITRSLRSDVDRVNGTVADATDRVHRALAVSEERLNDFNALIAVAQDEVEQLFVTAASTVRGVRRGAAALRERRGTDLASDELDEGDDALTTLEELDVDHNDSDPAAEALPAAPRIRPRAGHRRRA